MHRNNSEPFEVDVLQLERSRGGLEYILVIVDHFPQFVQAFTTCSKSGRTATEKILKYFIARIGFPENICIMMRVRNLTMSCLNDGDNSLE